MREYETVYILDPALTEADVKASMDRYGEIIARHEGAIFRSQNMGKKTLAYPIKKQTKGYYVALDYCGNNTAVSDIERSLKLDERVLRYLTVKFGDIADIDTRRKEIIEEEEALAKAMAEHNARKESAMHKDETSQREGA